MSQPPNGPLGPTREARELFWLSAILVLYGAVVATAITTNPPLGHDEAVYAMRADYFVGGGTEIGYWGGHRASGLPILLTPAWLLGGSDQAVRIMSAAIGALVIVASWHLGRVVAGPRVGLLAAALVAGSALVTESWLLLADVPAALFSTAAFTVLWAAMPHPKLPKWVWLVVPLGIAATLTRYGAPITLATTLTIAVVARPEHLRRHIATLVGLACALVATLAAILFVPWLTGSTVSPFDANRGLQEKVEGIGRLDSVATTPSLLWESLGPALTVVALGGLVAFLVSRDIDRDARRAGVVGLAAAAVVVLGLHLALFRMVPHYLAPALPFVALAPAIGLRSIVSRMPARAAAPLLVALALVVSATAVVDSYHAAKSLDRFDVLKEAAIAADAEIPTTCIIITSYSPQVGWYTDCDVISTPSTATAEALGFRRAILASLLRLEDRLDFDRPMYFLRVAGGKRQPDDDEWRSLADLTGRLIIDAGAPGAGGLRAATVHEFGTVGEIVDVARREAG